MTLIDCHMLSIVLNNHSSIARRQGSIPILHSWENIQSGKNQQSPDLNPKPLCLQVSTQPQAEFDLLIPQVSPSIVTPNDSSSFADISYRKNQDVDIYIFIHTYIYAYLKNRRPKNLLFTNRKNVQNRSKVNMNYTLYRKVKNNIHF